MIPHLVNVAMTRFMLFLFMISLPGADPKISQHIHFINIAHFPPVLQKRIVGGVYELWQRQRGVSTGVGFIFSVSAAFVGKESRMLVVWVCTAISANAMSCIRRSTG